MSKKDKPRSRWNVGNVRYTPVQQAEINKILREGNGWFRGARVYRK